MQNSISHCLQLFKDLKKGEGLDEDDLFAVINSVNMTIEEFEDSKVMQLMAQERAAIFKLFI